MPEPTFADPPHARGMAIGCNSWLGIVSLIWTYQLPPLLGTVNPNVEGDGHAAISI
ncbi:MAG TPA: hypothetical protein VJM31_15045 [Vicinamibacterales bacterium]|nr:hypothetical protein [Vicinamibacterales bacterium]